MNSSRVVLIALVALAAGVVASAAAQTLLLTLDSPNPQELAAFGFSVAVGDVSGDGKADMAVGAPDENVGGNQNQGRAYIFSGADGSLLFTLDTPNPQAPLFFARSVAVGDVNGDGKADIAAGAHYKDVGGTDRAGRAYVFSGADGSLLLTLDTPNPQHAGGFGVSVAVGDVNRDGRADIAVGAHGEYVEPYQSQGRAYVFSGADGSLLLTLDTPNPQYQGYFGGSLAVGDVNGDGKGDIAVGANYEDVGGNTDRGRAYVFSGADGSLLLTLNSPNPEYQGYFGESLGVGDVNGDGRGDIAVGAPQEDAGYGEQGRAYIFSGVDGSLLFTLDTPNPQYGARFGWSVAIGDVNGGGKADIAVSAYGENVGGNQGQGRAYVFSGADGSVLLTLDTPNPQADALFGHSVAVGDVNGDGNADMAVGAFGENVGGTRQGRAYVFASPPPPAVGGIAELPDVSDSSAASYVALAALSATALLGLTAGAWYARRRFSPG